MVAPGLPLCRLTSAVSPAPDSRVDQDAKGSSAHARAPCAQIPTVTQALDAAPVARPGDTGNLWKWTPLPDGPSPLPAPMGSYLSSPQPPLPPLVQRHPNPRPGPAPAPALALDGVRGGRGVRAGPLAQIPVWEPATPGRVVTEAWRRLPAKPGAIMGPDLPRRAWESDMKPGLRGAQHPRKSHSPVTIKIAPPERSGSPRASPGQSAHSVGRPRAEERPGPCAKDTVLRALSHCRKGSGKSDSPLWSETPESTGRTPDPEPRPSAFKPLCKHGEAPSFVPKPGPLDTRLPSWSSNICKGETDPGPVIQPSLSAANHTAGTVPAQGTEPPLGSWKQRQRDQDLELPSSAQGAVARVAFAPEADPPAGPCGC